MRKLLVAMMCVLALSGHAQTPVTINPMNRLQTVEGWGVSLCWWAAQAGQWDDAKINEIADWLVSPDGLNYNVFRYNIPGGDDPGHNKCVEHHMQKGKGLRAEMDGFIKDEHAPGDWDNWVYDWTADEAQIKMLRAIVAKAKEYGKEDILKIEAFSNSCPWWMTVSGCVSGSERTKKSIFGSADEQETNLQLSYYDDFARYLVEVCQHFKDVEGIEFYSLEPFNEPMSNNDWYTGGVQEGCYFKKADQIDFVKNHLAPELAKDKYSLNTIISVSDETNLGRGKDTFNSYKNDLSVMNCFPQWNVHTYDGSDQERKDMRDLVKAQGKRLWMSETGPSGDDKGLTSNLGLAQKMFNDIRLLQPVVWCDWQAMETNAEWCLLTCGGNNDGYKWPASPNKNFFVRSQVTRNIKEGYTILNTDNQNILAAISPNEDELVVCMLNTASTSVTYNLSVESTPWVSIKSASITDSSRDCAGFAVDDITNISVPKQSIVTVVVSGYFLPKKAVYLRNRATGRYLMNGGWWGSHAVVGNYPKVYYIIPLPNGKYDITSYYGHITDDGFVDSNKAGEYIAEWSILKQDGFNVLAYNQTGMMKALTANDSTYFNDNPLYRYATTAELKVEDKHQQWEIVTQEQLAAEIAKATADNPVNVTHYIKSANFDRVDGDDYGKWEFNNQGNSSWGNYSVTDEGINGADNDAFSNFNRSIRTKKVGTSSINKWDCYQVLSVPSGYYVVTNQGFEKGTRNTILYAWSNPEGSYVEKSVALATYNNDLSSENQIGAGRAFDMNKYHNVLPVLKVGEDGHLVIGVKKMDNNSTEGWMVFDNFQLYYLGTEKPNREYTYDVIAETRKAEMVDGALKLTGTWREVDMKEIASGPTTGNLEAELITNKPLLLDASANNFLVAKPEVVTTNAPANMMIKVADAADVANTQNVIANGQCANFVVTDKKEFGPQQTFTAQKVSYARSNTQGYNTVCMPFALTVNDFPETCTVYKYTRQTEDTAYFEEVGDDETIEAGTPVLVKDNTNAEGAAAKWEMNIVSSRGVVSAVSGNVNTEEKEGLNGSFLARSLGEGYFKLNSAGTKFVKTTSSSTITPFRFYLKEAVGGSAKAFDVVLNDEETAIEDIVNDLETKIEEIYDVSGRKVLTITRPGLYIMGGKKVLKR